MTILGGVALILFGARFLQKALDRLFGARLDVLTRRLAKNRFRACGVGFLLALLAPSSTTISALSVQSMRAGHFTPPQMLAMILGANVGLTVAVLVIALDFEQLAPALLVVGVVLFQFTKGEALRGIGQFVLSLGFLFLAMGLIRRGAGGFDLDGDLGTLLAMAEARPVLMALIAVGLALLLQSSKASLGLVIAMGAAGAVGPKLAVAAVVGVNAGLAATMLFLSLRHTEARRVSVANLGLKLLLGIPLLVMTGAAAEWMERLPGGAGTRVALFHVLFNIALVVVALPLVGWLSSLMAAVVPARQEPEPERFRPRHITGSPVGPRSIALGQSMRETLHMSSLVREMLADLWHALRTDDISSVREVSAMDNNVDVLDREIKSYLVQIAGREEGGSATAREQMLQLNYVTELENIGDIIDKNLCELVIKKITNRMAFSAEGWEELCEFHARVAENLLLADTVFLTRERSMAEQLVEAKSSLNALERKYRQRHFDRLTMGMRQTSETTAVHLDLLTHLKRINSCATHVGYAVLEVTDSTPSNPEQPDEVAAVIQRVGGQAGGAANGLEEGRGE